MITASVMKGLTIQSQTKKKLTYIFTFTLLSGASKGFMKAFIKAFEAPQRTVKIKIQVNFYFNTGF